MAKVIGGAVNGGAACGGAFVGVLAQCNGRIGDRPKAYHIPPLSRRYERSSWQWRGILQ